ncbi:ABC transporter ATP-binding protein [Falsiroseomonas sp.]|uniref:ABC transporter ATP-binding protein n=1 Tax=Falsiroseomonas sp. TaxID=2870721 RepID=UPI0035692A22
MAEPIVLLEGVAKHYPQAGGGTRSILEATTLAFPAGVRVGILGPNGTGKSTLLRLIAGSEEPDSGRVHRFGRVSFPLGFSGTFHPDLSGRENLLFLARVYGADPWAMVAEVMEFTELGPDIDAPVRQYSSGMAAKLAFGASLALDFDAYLVDEATEVGDARFRARSQAAFQEKLRGAALILVSHNSHTIRRLCECCAILHGGRLVPFPTVDEALAAYADLMGVADA